MMFYFLIYISNLKVYDKKTKHVILFIVYSSIHLLPIGTMVYDPLCINIFQIEIIMCEKKHKLIPLWSL